MKKCIFLIALVSNVLIFLNAANPTWVNSNDDYQFVIKEYTAWISHFGDVKYSVYAEDGYIEINADFGALTKGLRLGLTNIYNIYTKNHNREELKNYFTSVLNTLKSRDSLDLEMQDFITAKKYLKIKIYPNDYADFSHDKFIYKTDFNKLVSVVCVDTSYGIRPVNKSEIKNWGITEEEIFTFSLMQTGKTFNEKFVEYKLADNLSIYGIADYKNYYINSIVYFSELYKNYNVGHGIIIGIPSRHYIIIYPVTKNYLNDLVQFYNLLSRIYNGEEGKTTLEITYYNNDKYYPISPIENNGKVNFLMSEDANKLMK